MDKIILISGVVLLFISIGVIIYDRLKTRRIFDSLESMVSHAIRGDFSEDSYDESRFSRLESELCEYLRVSKISEANVKGERDKIRELISDISHQTKTPIANLLLYSEILLSEDIKGELRENVDAIHSQTLKLRFLIDNLIKLSRLENGILTLAPCRTDIKTVLLRVYEAYKTKAMDKGLELTIDCDSDTCMIDEKWTEEAISNIVDNAVKYTDSGYINISTTMYEMFLRVDIKDSGIGIDEDEIAKIFGRFYRVRDSKVNEGVGIGLHLAREIVSNEGGYIKVSSKKGEGSLFSVFLPR